MSCKFCQYESLITLGIVQSPISGHSYSLFKCRKCHSCFFNEKEHPVDLGEIYETLANDRQRLPTSFSSKRTWKRQKQTIINLLGNNPGSILDVGCRTGDFLMHFAGETKCTGVEISSRYAQIASQRGLEIINDALENISFTRQYEVVTCFAILEHLRDPLKFISSLQNIVIPGGLLIIMIPSIQTIKAKYCRSKWHMLSPPEHLNFFSKNFIDSYLKERQFDRIMRYYSSGGMLFYKGKCSLIIKTEALFTQFLDYSLVNRIPIFDHMYSYYLKR